jgi:hypothetical protein
VPQLRNDNELAPRQGLHPHALLFAARSPVSTQKIPRASKKGLFNLIRVVAFARAAEAILEQIV